MVIKFFHVIALKVYNQEDLSTLESVFYSEEYKRSKHLIYFVEIPGGLANGVFHMSEISISKYSLLLSSQMLFSPESLFIYT